MKKILLTLILIFATGSAQAQSSVSEDRLKAAFIFHFLNFTEWDDKLTNYYVCIPDDEVLRKAAEEALKGKVVNGRMVFVFQSAPVCHVIVSDKEISAPGELTIGSLKNGALLEFRQINNKLRFAANVEKIKESKLKISSQLLKLAILEN